MIGYKNNYWEVLSFAGKNRFRKFLWLCRCKCGKEKIHTTYAIKRCLPKSCGCYIQARRGNTSNHIRKHGLSHKHPLYRTWKNMRQRCFNQSNQDYNWYGGKGITLSDDWRDNFKSFYDWSITNGWKKGLVIDRIDSDKDYSASNCRFITMSENSKKVFLDNPGLNKGSNHKDAILDEEKVREIKKRIKRGDKNCIIAHDFRINDNIIYQIKKNKTWRHVLVE